MARKMRSGTSALLGGVIMATVLSSCAGVSRTSTNTPPPAPFKQAQVLYLRGDYRKALEGFSNFILTFPHSPYTADASIWKGKCHLKLGEVEAAEESFRRAIERPRNECLANLAKEGLADCAFMKGDFRKAARIYRSLLDAECISQPRTLYQLAESSLRAGDTAEARRRFEQLVSTYSDSKYAETARVKLRSGLDVFRIQAGAFSIRSNADRLRNRLIQKGFPAYIELSHLNGTTLYCVRIGRFDSWREAERKAAEVRRTGFHATVVP